MKKMSYIFITIGILTMLYPFFNNLYQSYWQQNLLNQVDIAESLIEDYQLLNEFFYEELDFFEEQEVEAIESTEEVVNNSSNLLGTIEIAKINLKLPILLGTSSSNLRKAAGHLSGTNFPGEVGNSVIAAHRGRKYGVLFNRLDELEAGDKIVITSKGEKHEYTVYLKKLVEPTDLSVLNRNSKDKVLTLITCDPIQNPTHRIIIHAKM